MNSSKRRRRPPPPPRRVVVDGGGGVDKWSRILELPETDIRSFLYEPRHPIRLDVWDVSIDGMCSIAGMLRKSTIALLREAKRGDSLAAIPIAKMIKHAKELEFCIYCSSSSSSTNRSHQLCKKRSSVPVVVSKFGYPPPSLSHTIYFFSDVD